LCYPCDPFVGVGFINGICESLCDDWFNACRDDLFAVTGDNTKNNGPVVPCTEHSSVCSPLRSVVKSGREFCQRSGLEVSLKEDDLLKDTNEEHTVKQNSKIWKPKKDGLSSVFSSADGINNFVTKMDHLRLKQKHQPLLFDLALDKECWDGNVKMMSGGVGTSTSPDQSGASPFTKIKKQAQKSQSLIQILTKLYSKYRLIFILILLIFASIFGSYISNYFYSQWNNKNKNKINKRKSKFF